MNGLTVCRIFFFFKKKAARNFTQTILYDERSLGLLVIFFIYFILIRAGTIPDREEMTALVGASSKNPVLALE